MSSVRVRGPILDVIATAAIVAAAAVIIWDRLAGQTEGPRVEPRAGSVSLKGVQMRGSIAAPAILLIFSDFECPFCGTFARDTLPDIERRYVGPGLVRLAFMHFPLPNHRNAEKTAEAAECAGRQNRFWEMHDALFARQDELTVQSLITRAQDVRLDLDRFTVCLEGATAAKVRADVDAGRSLRVRGTPSFFFGTLQSDASLDVASNLSGAAPLAAFNAALDEVLETVKVKHR